MTKHANEWFIQIELKINNLLKRFMSNLVTWVSKLEILFIHL
jgi:hypothetical protein